MQGCPAAMGGKGYKLAILTPTAAYVLQLLTQLLSFGFILHCPCSPWKWEIHNYYVLTINLYAEYTKICHLFVIDNAIDIQLRN